MSKTDIPSELRTALAIGFANNSLIASILRELANQRVISGTQGVVDDALSRLEMLQANSEGHLHDVMELARSYIEEGLKAPPPKHGV